MREINSNVNFDIQKRIECADIILVIVDENFTENISLNEELQLALDSIKKNKNQILFLIVTNNAVVPAFLEGMRYFKCDSRSKNDICKVKEEIEKVLNHKKYNIKKGVLKKSYSKTFSMIILTLAIEMFAMLFVVLYFEERPFNMGGIEDNDIFTMSIGMISAMLALVALITSYLSIMKRRWQEDDKEEIESYSRRLQKAIVPEEAKQGGQESSANKETKKEIDALGRMMINLEDIKEFYTWSQKQAKASFILAVSMCILGFILMIFAIFLPIIFSLSFQMSLVPALGGVITELVAGTALAVYKKSLVQLNHYHKALHEDERFLSSVNLLGKFSTIEAQDDMLREIIRSEIQMNLIGLEEDNKKDEKKKSKESNYEADSK